MPLAPTTLEAVVSTDTPRPAAAQRSAWRVGALLGVGLGALLALSPGSVAVALAAAAIGWALQRDLGPGARRFVLRLFVFGLAGRVILSLGLDAAAWALQGAPPFSLQVTSAEGAIAHDASRAFVGAGDSDFYSVRGYNLVEYARGVRVPRTLSAVYQPYGWNGYLYLIGFFYYLFGFSPVSVKFVNAVMGAALGPLLYRLVKGWTPGPVARAAAVVVSCIPSLVLWSVTNLKDTAFSLVTFLLLGAFFRLRQEPLARKGSWLLALGAGLVVHASLRSPIYSALLAGGLALGWVLTGAWPRLAKGAAVLGLLAAAWWARERLQQALALAFFHHVGHILTPGVSYKFLPEAFYANRSMAVWLEAGSIDLSLVPHILRAAWLYLIEPLPGHMNSASALLTYPQMWVYYVLGLPWAVVGFVALARRRPAYAVPLALVLAGWIVMAAITSANLGSVFRQRDMVTPFIAFFAVVGLWYGLPWLAAGRIGRLRLPGIVDLLALVLAAGLLASGQFVYGLVAGRWDPEIKDVQPTIVRQGLDRHLRVNGVRFDQWTRVAIGGRPMSEVRFLSPQLLEVTLPPDLALGTHGLRVTDYRQRAAVLQRAFVVEPPPRRVLARMAVNCLFLGVKPEAMRIVNELLRLEPGREDMRAVYLQRVHRSGRLTTEAASWQEALQAASHAQDAPQWFLANLELPAVTEFVDPPVSSYEGQVLDPGDPLRVVMGGYVFDGWVTSAPRIIKLLEGLPASPEAAR